eukprot:GFUD01017511.1.p1 GENE.GFUD01017511.1~~GFUD01017511.1.p1  ORF type:complete len:1648 (+),score=501.50 GFUD01017511.1:169-5112(+)
MASTWDSKYIIESISEDYEEHFKKESENSLLTYYKGLLNNCKKAVSYKDSLQITVSAWEYISQYEVVTNADQVATFVECLAKASRHILLSGDWLSQEKVSRDYLETLLKKCVNVGAGKKETVEAVLALAQKPWDSQRVRNLLTGRTELQQQVLSLVSTEGVDCVLLRIELLVEAGLDKPAYKFVSNVTNSLLADHIVFESYVLTSKPGTLERIVDMFLALAVATRHESRLYKVLKLVGLEMVNKTYMPRFYAYISPPVPPPTDPKLLVSLGRCKRLFTNLVCSKVIQVFAQWSIAGAAVKECPGELQGTIIHRWLESKIESGKGAQSIVPDVETLMQSANQTSFLYTMAILLWRKFGKEVETLCLRMFIKGLTSDLNNTEASKKNKSKKAEIESRMAKGFWYLSEVVSDRVSLAREAVLTGFSISPSAEMFDKIKELAAHSGLDKLVDEEDEKDVSFEDVPEESLGLHCRVTLGEETPKAKLFTRAHQAKHSMVHLMPDNSNTRFTQMKSGNMDFSTWCTNLTGGLSVTKFAIGVGRANTKLRTNGKIKKKFRNLEGLLSIQGELITEASNYNPLDQPCKSLSHENLGLSKEITDDLLIVIAAPRWHLLSWVMDWSDLEGTCAKLLANPSIREPSEELKFLNIDYTQFDEWSSDEEVTIYTGIEKGYEKWLEVPSEDDKFSEHGLTSEDEEVEFNHKHTIDRPDYDDHEVFVTEKDYHVNSEKVVADVVMVDKESKHSSSKNDNINESFPGTDVATAMEINDEITDEPEQSDPVDANVSNVYRFVDETLEPEPEKPDKKVAKNIAPTNEDESVMDVNFAFINPTHNCTKLKARLALARLVPGLEGSAVPKTSHTSQICMVQISGGVVSQTPGTSPPANSPSVTQGTLLLRPGPSGVTRPGLTRVTAVPSQVISPRPGQTTVRLSPATSPRIGQVLGGPRPATPGSPAKKIQYICKQGGQTFVIESTAVLEKLRSAGLTAGMGNVQLRLPIAAVRPATAVTTVGTESKTDMSEGLAGRLGTLLTSPKVTSTTTTTLATRLLPSQGALVNAGLTQVKNVTTTVVAKTPATVTEPGKAAENNGGPADLIRQLNLARAQGLVVLQQWGDKQVLVHKATGRWIMRQGSRLVTVPPQALGISTDGNSSASSSPGAGGPAISSRTMEQLAEFDSILESKFKTESGEVTNGGVVVVSGAGNTRQVIQLPTTPLKKELVLSKDGIKQSISPVKSPLLPAAATFPKPQEDPETMKRIQAILDDYNDQIRNSPDLHNRPAPRRRTNGSGNPDSPKADSPTGSGTASGSTSPNNVVRRCGSESLSPGPGPSPSMSPVKDPLTVAMAEIKESGALTLTAQPNIEPLHTPAPAPAGVTSVRLVPKGGPVTQRIMVPAGNTRGIMMGGQGTVQRLMVVASGDGRRMVAVRPVVVTTNSFTNSVQPSMVTTNSCFTLSGTNSIPITVSLPTSPVSLASLPSILNTRPASPPRPSTPGLGIPMEMTPGQIMEAEISATLLDNPSSPFQSGSLTTLSDESDQVCASLPDNVFSVSSPGPSCPGLDSDFDQVISTSGPQQLATPSHLTDMVSSHTDLPVESSITHQSTQDNTQSSSQPNRTGRRRSGRSELSQPESKKVRLNNYSEIGQPSNPVGISDGSTTVPNT